MQAAHSFILDTSRVSIFTSIRGLGECQFNGQFQRASLYQGVVTNLLGERYGKIMAPKNSDNIKGRIFSRQLEYFKNVIQRIE